MNPRTLRQLPRYLLLLTANALPVYGACTGAIVFFQVIWLYWLESLLLIGFDLIRIAFAKGAGAGPDADPDTDRALQAIGDTGALPVRTRLGLMFGTLVTRILILGFYLLFLIVFVGLQVTDDAHAAAVGESIAFRDAFVNTAFAIFAINGTVQLVAGFFLNGLYRRISPRMYTDVVGVRTIVMHVMIVSSVFIHLYLFKDKPYARIGEGVYVGLFMTIRTVLDIRHARRQDAPGPEPVVMI